MFKGNVLSSHFRSTPSLSLLEAWLKNDVSFLSVRLPKYVRKGMSVRIEVVASSAAAAIPFARDSPCHHMLCSHCSSLLVER